MIGASCPQCQKKYRLKPEQSGKKARCSACRHVFVVSCNEPEPRHEWFPAAPALEPEQQIAIPDEWAGAGDESDAEQIAHDDFAEWSEPEPPAQAPAPTPARDSTMGSLALDRMKLTYAVQWWGLWAACVSLAGLLGFYFNALIAPMIVLPMSWICVTGSVSGIAYLAVQEIARGEPVHWSEGWGLFRRRSLSLVIGSWMLSFGVVAVLALSFAALFALSHAPYVGTPIGGALIIPTFTLILFAFVLTCNLHLLIVIVGVEDCSAWQALQLLIALIRRDGFALLGWSYLSPFLVTLGTTLAVGVLTALGLGGALALCGGEQLLFVLTDGVSLGNVLHVASATLIVAGALAFITVFATLQFTVLYCRFA